MTKELLSNIAELAENFVANRKSMHVATVDITGFPLASYTPFYRDASSHFHILVSDLSSHTKNLLAGKANILLIEDESECKQIYARTRLNFPCTVLHEKRGTEQYAKIIKHLHHRHGEVISTISELADFRLLKLTPSQGVFVRGFGQAYTIDPMLTTVVPIMPG